MRRILTEAAATFSKPGIERYLPSTVSAASLEDLAGEALTIARELPDDSEPLTAVSHRIIELLCLLDRVLFNLVAQGPRSHDPMVPKYLGGRVRRYWGLTLRLTLGAEMPLWLPNRLDRSSDH